MSEQEKQDVELKLKRPSFYKVVLLNDDFTPVDFVVSLLEQVFYKSRAEAQKVTMDVHQKGAGHCGNFTFEVAETKVAQVIDRARSAEHPLQCTMERA